MDLSYTVRIHNMAEDRSENAIDCQDDRTPCRTYGELLSRLSEDGVSTDGLLLFDEKGERLYQEQDIEFLQEDRSLSLRGTSVAIEQFGIEVPLHVPFNCTVKRLKDFYKRATNQKTVQQLSLEGKELPDSAMLCDFAGSDHDRLPKDKRNIDDVEQLKIMAEKKISIKDKDCSLITDVVVYDHMTLDAVLRKYEEAAQRKLMLPQPPRKNGDDEYEYRQQDETKTSAILYIEGGSAMDLQTKNSDNVFILTTVFRNNIKNDDELLVHNPKFTVNVVDMVTRIGKATREEVYKIDAFDIMTIEGLRKSLNAMIDFRLKLEPEDTFTVGPNMLMEKDVLYKKRITQDSKIVIVREVQQQPALLYMCGSCGLDVRLRMGEPVKCRNCEYGILYKAKTKNVMQFECR